MSLRARLLAGLAVIALVYLGVVGVVTNTIHRDLVKQVDDRLSQVLQGPDGRGRGPDDRGVAPTADGQLPPNRGFSDLYLGWAATDGTLYTAFSPNLSGQSLGSPTVSAVDVNEALAGSRDVVLTTGAASGQGQYRVRLHKLATPATLTANGTTVTALVQVVAQPLTEVDRTVSSLVAVEALGFLAALIVLAAVAWWVNRLGIRPIKQMTATAGTIAEAGGDDLTVRVPESAPHTEAGQLARALNRMLGRIESAVDERTRSEDRLRQFVADASHELRTPLTTIRGYAELYRHGGLASVDTLTDAMARTEQEAQRMSRLVEDMLTLAKFDQHRALETHPVDLALLVADAGRDAAVVAPDRRITTEIAAGPTPGDDMVVAGDADRLRQVLANVVGNALVHTPATSGITLRAARTGDRVVVEVADEGPGMPPEVAARITERFYRADPARARHRGGSGLGMAIVDAIVAAHGGEVDLDTAPERGTTVRITLPVEAPPAPPEPANGTGGAELAANGSALGGSGMGGPGPAHANH